VKKAKPDATAQRPLAQEQGAGAAKKEPVVDQYGDPLPQGAVARLGTVRFRHAGMLTALNFAHGGRTLVGATNYGGIIVWDAATGRELHRLGNGAMDVSPDGSTLATVRSNTDDDTVQLMLWDIRTGKLIGTVPLPGKAPEGEGLCFVRFAADGKSVVYAWRDYAHVVDLPSGKVRAKLAGSQAHRIWSIALSPDGKTLALGVSGLLLGDIAGANKMRRLNVPLAGWTTAVGFSPDGRIVAWGIQDHVLLSDPSTGKELNRLQAPMGGVRAVAFTPDGKTILSASLDGKIRVWDVATGNLRRTLDGRMRWVFTMALSPDGKTVALGTGHQIIRLWDVATGQELHTRFQGHVSSVGGLAFSGDGQILVSSSNDEEVRTWSTKNWKQIGFLPGINRPLGRSPTLSLSPDGKHLAFVSEGKTIRTRDIAKGQDSLTIAVPETNDVVSARFSTDGRSLISLDRTINAQYDQTSPFRVQRWDASTGQRRHRWVLPERIRVLLAGDTLLLTADGKRVLRSGGSADKGEGAIRLYDFESGGERPFAGRDNELLGSLALSPDGRLVAAGEWGGRHSVSIWEMATRKKIVSLTGHERSVDALAWSRDGRVVAAADFWYYRDKIQDCSIRVWDAITGKELAQFNGLKNDVTALTFSPDDTYLAAGLRDSTIVVWDVKQTLKDSKPASRKLTLEELENCWSALASPDARLAHDAAWRLISASNHAATFLRGEVRPATSVDTKKVEGWIADLDSDKFRVRETASKELEGIGGQAVPLIQRALEREISLETRRRLEHVLRQVFTSLADVPSLQTVRSIRAIMVLERIASPEAQAVLATLASGAPGARETEDAEASLERLKARVLKLP
jgi:WD40 repeat protein